MKKILSLDIGGSSIKYALIDVNGDGIKAQSSPATRKLSTRNFEELEQHVIDIAYRNQNVETIGISTTGSVDENGIVLNAGHFIGYSNIDWQKILSTYLKKNINVYVLNDGRASTRAEYQQYVSSSQNFAHIVVGTGIGGALVIDKRIVLGDAGLAGNIGHLVVTNEPTIECSCSKQGCVETLASTRGLVSHFVNLQSHSQEKVQFNDIVCAAKNGDSQALEAFKLGGFWLGRAISYVVNLINPSNITIGGGVLDATIQIQAEVGYDPYFESVLESIKKSSHRRPLSCVELHRAKFGNNGGLLGAALHCWDASK